MGQNHKEDDRDRLKECARTISAAPVSLYDNVFSVSKNSEKLPLWGKIAAAHGDGV